MQDFDRLQELFMRFPGVGRRQAKRFAYFTSTQSGNFRSELTRLISETGNSLRECIASHQHFFSNDSNEKLSPIERDVRRDKSLLMIVEKDIDLETIEKSGAYSGTYFVLGSLISVVNGNAQEARIPNLLQHVKIRASKHALREIIIALSLNPESEHTRLYIEEQLKPIQQEFGFIISRLGRGLSTGSELEYSDKDTLRAALESRK